MVLEYIKGTTLRERMIQSEPSKGREAPAAVDTAPWLLSSMVAVELILPVVRALTCAHEHGIVHRDLKPENILLDEAGKTKVLDFGIARQIESRRVAIITGVMAALDHGDGVVQDDRIIGTPPYMSPEQLLGADVDYRADIWAVGIMLYEMLTGGYPLEPFSLARLPQIVDINVPMPSVRERRPDVGPLGVIVDRCLKKRKAERVGSANELLVELEALQRLAAAALVDEPWENDTVDVLASSTDGEAPRPCAAEPIRPPPAGYTAAPNNLPLRRRFIGREAELAALRCALEEHRGAGMAQPVSIYGLGGMGKTALALEYAHRSCAAYPGGVLWLHAEGKPADAMARLAEDLRRIGSPATRDVIEREPSSSADGLARAAQLALQRQDAPCLLVLDNVDAENWRELLPGGEVRILITTRDKRLALGHRTVLSVLLEPSATQLACGLAGETESEDEKAALRRVLEQLDGLPVAVEMAARAVSEWFNSWVDYERHLRTEAVILLERRELLEGYPRGVSAALDISIDRCEPGSPARRLLEGAASFAPDSVPLDWAMIAADLDPQGFDARKARETLKGLGLVAAAGSEVETLSMHQLVHWRVRTRAEAERSAEWIEVRARAAACVATWLGATVDPARIAQVDIHLPHVQEALHGAWLAGREALWITITDRLATHLHLRGWYEDARILFELALETAEGLDPPDEVQLSASQLNLAAVLRDLGRSAEAHPLLERSLALAERAFGPDHPKIALRFSVLGSVLHALGRSNEAISTLECALGIGEAAYGRAHPKNATVLMNLANVLRGVGDVEGARDRAERSLEILEGIYGPDHPKVARRLASLAKIYRDLGRRSSAVEMLDRAIDIELNYSVDHPRIERMRSLRKELRNDIERAQEQVPPARRAEARPAPARGSARSHADLHEEPFSDAPTAPADDDDPSCNAVSVGEDAAGYSKGLNPLPLSGSLAEKAPSSGRAEAAERVLRKVLTSILHHLRKRDV